MTLKLTEEQVLWFRARRGHLAGPGAVSAREAVRAILGAQSQQQQPSLIGVSQRTRGRPTSAELEEELFGKSPTLVRTWGQRDTLFLFDPQDCRHFGVAETLKVTERDHLSVEGF